MDEAANAAARLRIIVRVLNRQAQAETEEGSPTRSQQAVLAWLAERGELTPGALAVAERVRPQSMSELVDALERRGWAARRPDPADRRQVLVSLTAAGDEALDRGRRLRQARLSDAIRTLLDDGERERLIAAIGLLERVVLGDQAQADAGGVAGSVGTAPAVHRLPARRSRGTDDDRA